jgi:hypothetical protein
MRWRRIAANKDILVGRIWVAMSDKTMQSGDFPTKIKNPAASHRCPAAHCALPMWVTYEF